MLGFIITRHVNSVKTNLYWNYCIKQIQKIYPENKIVIIDDNSDYSFVKNLDIDVTNCTFIQSEFPKRGEFLPYYYLNKYHFFDVAVIMHDSVFLQKKLSIENTETVKPLWHFDHEFDHVDTQFKLLKRLNNNELNEFHGKSNKWMGCFGIMTIINYYFLNKIYEKYNLSIFLDYVVCRDDRCDLERVLSLIFFYEDRILINRPSIYGNILHYLDFGYKFEKYFIDLMEHNKKIIEKPIIKVWSGR